MSRIIDELTDAVLPALKQTFLVFDQNTLWERSVRVDAEKSLSSADYLLVMQQTVRTNDIESEEIHGSYGLLSGVSLSPGLDSRCLFRYGDTDTLYAAMKAGILLLANGYYRTLRAERNRIRNGASFDREAFIPKESTLRLTHPSHL